MDGTVDARGVAMTCPVCGGPVLLTTYGNRVYHNRTYCSIRCRRDAGHAKEREQRTSRAADWTDFWAALGDVPTFDDSNPLERLATADEEKGR
jgi:hypothetical protein